MKPVCILVTGRDPEAYFSCSHSSYVRTHAFAARRAGYEVHVICLARSPHDEATPYGHVHALPTPLSLVRQNMIALHSPVLVRGVIALAETLGRPALILHGFGVWGHAVVTAHDRLARLGIASARLLSSYTTYLDESLSQSRGLAGDAGVGAHARLALQRAWIRTVVARYERRAYRGVDKVLVNYQSVRRLVLGRFGADAACQVIPYSIEPAFLGEERPQKRARGGARSDPPKVVCVARHDPRKGVDVLLQALRRLRQSGVAFSAQLVGDGDLLESHRRLAAKLQLTDCVEIVGPAPSVDPYLAEADVFVLPSREEQSGSLALIEALRVGVACVSSGCDGIPEDVRHGQDAWLTRPGDAQSLSEGLAAMIGDPDLRRRLALAGRRVFDTRFSADGFAGALDRVYQDALSGIGAAA
jgi:glycosyltransferase involved in cell wall biosynthesis